MQLRLCNFDSALTATSAWQAQLYVNGDFCQTKLGEGWSQKLSETFKHWMHWCECHLRGLHMENMDHARIFDTWKSTKNWRALPLELDDDQVRYVGNLNNFSASFCCMYFCNTMRHEIIFIFNTNGQYQVFFFTVKCWQKVWKFEWSVIILKPFTLKCMCTLQTSTLIRGLRRATIPTI